MIYTIHQPSSEIFKLFDKLLLLTQGKMAYLGQSSDAVEYFSKLNFVCPKHYNPAEFFIKILSKEALAGDETSEEMKRHEQEYIDRIEKITKKCGGEVQLIELGKIAESKGSTLKKKNPFFKELGILMRRNNLLLMREPLAFIVKIVMSILNSVIVIMIFWNMAKDDNAIRKKWLLILHYQLSG